MLPALDLDFVRAQFPALSGDWVFFDNAGGSQTLRTVAERISDYLLTSNVQTRRQLRRLAAAGAPAARRPRQHRGLIDAARPDEIVMGRPPRR